MTDKASLEALVEGRHNNPFAVLGIQREQGRRIVRTFQPGATAVQLIDEQGKVSFDYRPVHMYTLTDECDVIPPKNRVY